VPIHYARRLVGAQRTPRANRHLGLGLAGVAGAANAGGFLAVQQYTSHMTGVVSAMADHLALGDWLLFAAGLASLGWFVLGAIASTLMVGWARRRRLHSEYAAPLLLEALLLLCFGLMGQRLASVGSLMAPATVSLLCFVMGLQNAVITKLSGAEIRTTHVTGIVTDIGIEIGRRLQPGNAVPDALRLRLLLQMAGAFFAGALSGAIGFKAIGYVFTVPLALLLVLLAAVPAADDLAGWLRARKR